MALLVTVALIISASSQPFLVAESAAGDLNGDGDSADVVLHVFDPKRQVTLNLGLAAATVCRTIVGPPFVSCIAVEAVTGHTIVAFLVSETAQGNTDLNADGDTIDDVVHVFDSTTGGILNTMLAAAHGVGRDVSSYVYPVMPLVVGDAIALLIAEVEHGGADLNRDGDAADYVLHIIESKSFEVRNLELAAATVPGPFGVSNPIWPALDGPHLTVVSDDQVTYRLNMHNGKLRLQK